MTEPYRGPEPPLPHRAAPGTLIDNLLDKQRTYARQLAAEAVAAGDDTGWFERLYADAAVGQAVVPWDDPVANPLLRQWTADDRHQAVAGQRALVVGCGVGWDAEHLAGLGLRTTAFDVAPSAIETVRARHPKSTVDYRVADLLHPPAGFEHAFDLVFEAYTVQVLQGRTRAGAIAAFARLVAPGGTLLVVARARERDDPPGRMPWPLTRDEMEAFAVDGLRMAELEDVLDTSEEPPVRRWRATLWAGG